MNHLFRTICSTLLTALLVVGSGIARGQDPVASDAEIIEPPVGAPLMASIVSPPVTAFPRFWVRTDYLLWWSKNGPLSAPLATAGSSHDAVPGALGQPHTAILYGGNGIDFGAQGGFRLDWGWWLNERETVGIESGFFFVGGNAPRFSAFSNSFGFPVIARPTINAATSQETSYADSMPGDFSGGITISNTSQLFSWDINGAVNLIQNDRWRLDGLLGFRYLNLFESLRIEDQLYPFDDNSLIFLGQPISSSSYLMDGDRFATFNNFYGGQLGTRYTWLAGRWTVGATGKVALGTTREMASIHGRTFLFSPDGSITYMPGGVLATSANSGRYTRNEFAVVPEVGLNLGFRISPRMTARFGYSFLYWSNVLRPGNQVNRVVSGNLVPTDGNYGTPGPNLPDYQFHSASYWAQGLNFGLEFAF